MSLQYELVEEDFLPRVSEDSYEDVGMYSMYEYWEDYKQEERYEREN